ncbi:MAG: FAD-dependent monooxygenase [Bryobacteraceae bacterium]|nr:FAD-dependent monooxygenase [Bryobacteraceae bacterium]
MGTTVSVAGGGLAGSAAALAALAAGAGVRLFEKSAFPRHKVCGEFLSPEVVGLLEELGAAESLLAAHPAPMRRAVLRVGRVEKSWTLEETAYGMSRYRLDQLLLELAVERGAQWERAKVDSLPQPYVWAVGRTDAAPRGERLFGFKAHFTGPANDAVELYFFRGGYVGVNSVEGGYTNVCGLCREELLPVDGVLGRMDALRERLRPLTQVFDWLHTGPLVFRQHFETERYAAGDALSFVDPFTGTGMLSALISGQSAGRCAATGVPAGEHLAYCRRRLKGAFAASSLYRRALECGWAERLLPFVPSAVLFRSTRPK